MRNRIWTSALALGCAVALSATASLADNMDLDEMGALVVAPVLTGEFTNAEDSDSIMDSNEVFTLVTVTNGSDSAIRLVVDVVSGDNGTGSDGADSEAEDADNWSSTSFTCDLTGGETTTFVFAPGNFEETTDNPNTDLDETSLSINGSKENSVVFVECSDLANNDTEGDPRAIITEARSGFVVIAVADPNSGNVISQDVLLADAVIVDTNDSEAYSFNAIPFQAGFGQNNGDKVYHMDGSEYAMFPGVLATNFIAPTTGGNDPDLEEVNAELILFTLDGSLGTTEPPRVKLGGLAYNDDEEYVDFQYEFDCFDIVELQDLNPNIVFHPTAPLGLGSPTGHLRLVSQPTATGNDAHDDQYGDGNDTRRRSVHGWIVQSVEDEDILLPGNVPAPGTPQIDVGSEAAWGRPLSQSRTALVPFLGDKPSVLDADVLN